MRNKQVMEMLGAKFGNKNAGAYVMTAEEKALYQLAQSSGDVALMLKIKSGQLNREQKQKAFEEEVESLDIEKVVKELKTIEPKKAQAKKSIEAESDRIKADIEQKFEAEQQKLFKRGISRGSRQHLILVGEFTQKLEEVENHPTIQKLQRELSDIQERQEQLEYMKAKFQEDNQELIEEARKERIKRQLKELDLID